MIVDSFEFTNTFNLTMLKLLKDLSIIFLLFVLLILKLDQFPLHVLHLFPEGVLISLDASLVLVPLLLEFSPSGQLELVELSFQNFNFVKESIDFLLLDENNIVPDLCGCWLHALCPQDQYIGRVCVSQEGLLPVRKVVSFIHEEWHAPAFVKLNSLGQVESSFPVYSQIHPLHWENEIEIFDFWVENCWCSFVIDSMDLRSTRY